MMMSLTDFIEKLSHAEADEASRHRHASGIDFPLQKVNNARVSVSKLILVRHGESRHQVDGLIGGWTDTPLTALGRRQADTVGYRLAEDGLGPAVRLLSSDLLRARETSEAIARHTGQTVVLHQELRELGNGVAAGKTLEETERLILPKTDPVIDWIPYQDAESWRMMSSRVISLLEQVQTEEPDSTIVVVSHGNALIPAVFWWLGLGSEYWSTISFAFDNASITELTINSWGERTIFRLNDVSHLRLKPGVSR